MGFSFLPILHSTVCIPELQLSERELAAAGEKTPDPGTLSKSWVTILQPLRGPQPYQSPPSPCFPGTGGDCRTLKAFSMGKGDGEGGRGGGGSSAQGRRLRNAASGCA